MSLYQVLERFSSEEECIEHLEKLRWPKGVCLPLLWEQSQDIPH